MPGTPYAKLLDDWESVLEKLAVTAPHIGEIPYLQDLLTESIRHARETRVRHGIPATNFRIKNLVVFPARFVRAPAPFVSVSEFAGLSSPV
jgi:hypothetical protein